MEDWLENLSRPRAVRFTKANDEKICEAARLYKISVANFVRQACLEKAQRLIGLAKRREHVQKNLAG